MGGDDISLFQFANTEYRKSARAIASEEIKTEILEIGINKFARDSGCSQELYQEAGSWISCEAQFL
jgi:hypothetical protein